LQHGILHCFTAFDQQLCESAVCQAVLNICGLSSAV